jgi:hypothetical protein
LYVPASVFCLQTASVSRNTDDSSNQKKRNGTDWYPVGKAFMSLPAGMEYSPQPKSGLPTSITVPDF